MHIGPNQCFIQRAHNEIFGASTYKFRRKTLPGLMIKPNWGTRNNACSFSKQKTATQLTIIIDQIERGRTNGTPIRIFHKTLPKIYCVDKSHDQK